MADLEYAQDDAGVGFDIGEDGGYENTENGDGQHAELEQNEQLNEDQQQSGDGEELELVEHEQQEHDQQEQHQHHESYHHGHGGGGHHIDDSDTDDRKIFVGGLAWDLVESELKDHFSQFGEVEVVDLKKDLTTGKNRGFCFITFKDCDCVKKVLSTSNHYIGKKPIDCKKAKSRGGKEPKVFVGGVEAAMAKEDISAHFAQFGEVKDVIWPKNKFTDQKQSYVFVMFDKMEEAKKALAHPETHVIGEKEVDVREATPAPDPNRRGRGRGGYRGDYGGRGRGRGRGGGGYYNQGYYDHQGYNHQGYGGGYGGYDYHPQYYDYSGYGDYGHQYNNQGYYDPSYGYGGYGADQSGYYQGYNYSDWYNYNNQGGQQQSNYGKAPRRGGGNQQVASASSAANNTNASSSQYHPYSRQ
ncbi:uncharacterized protein LOC141904060 [Tubulanus polymorphus]|uniref:uncharacterized protein LOC141904060 n=1 Tax=Tubulanus polymorphus TaxID=672921 RepID=UPI003DA4C9D8